MAGIVDNLLVVTGSNGKVVALQKRLRYSTI